MNTKISSEASGPSRLFGLREMLSRGVGAALVLIGAAAVIGVMLARHGTAGLPAGKFLVGLVLGGVAIATGWGQLFPNHYAPIPIDHDDPLMRESIEQARREIGRFREGVRQGRKEAFAKFPMKVANDETEHIWGIVHSIDGDVASVSLVNTPVNEPEQKDPRFNVAIAELEDWMLTDQSEFVEGGYTHLALARVYKREKGYVPRGMRKDLTRFRDLDLSGV